MNVETALKLLDELPEFDDNSESDNLIENERVSCVSTTLPNPENNDGLEVDSKIVEMTSSTNSNDWIKSNKSKYFTFEINLGRQTHRNLKNERVFLIDLMCVKSE